MPTKIGNKPEIIGSKPELKIALNMPFELWGQIKWSIIQTFFDLFLLPPFHP